MKMLIYSLALSQIADEINSAIKAIQGLLGPPSAPVNNGNQVPAPTTNTPLPGTPAPPALTAPPTGTNTSAVPDPNKLGLTPPIPKSSNNNMTNTTTTDTTMNNTNTTEDLLNKTSSTTKKPSASSDSSVLQFVVLGTLGVFTL